MMRTLVGRMATALLLLLVTPTLVVAHEVVLIEVNGEAITDADMDRMVMEQHRTGSLANADTAFLERLLNKAVNDELLVQEAFAMGLDAEDVVTRPLIQKYRKALIRTYAQNRFDMPQEPDPAAVRAYFEKYYWRVQLRQLSTRTIEEARAVAARIEAGEPMADLALELSVDSHKYRQGAHNLKHWADVENIFRDQARELAVGQLSEPFPVREAFSLLRVEERQPLVESEFAELKKEIEVAVLTETREAKWKEFVAEHVERYDVRPDSEVLAGIQADAEVLYRGEFLKQNTRPALVVDEQVFLTETELRKAISHAAMSMGDKTFDEVFAATLESETEDLVLRAAAVEAGFEQDATLIEMSDAALRQAVLDQYLNEMVVGQITFRREEFEAFYEENRDRFTGPDEVKIDILICEDEDQARDVAKRLREGADFEYLRREVQGNDEITSAGETKWTPLEMFSDNIKTAVAGLEIGGTSEATPFGEGWMVLELEGKRAGPVKPMDEAEMEIRQAMFQIKFKEMLDEQLRRLEEVSEIVRHEENIKAYFKVDS